MLFLCVVLNDLRAADKSISNVPRQHTVTMIDAGVKRVFNAGPHRSLLNLSSTEIQQGYNKPYLNGLPLSVCFL